MNKMTQNEEILSYLLRHEDITPLDALATFGCMRLGARIWDLRHNYNVDIKGRMVTVNTRGGTADVASYSLVDKKSAKERLDKMIEARKRFEKRKESIETALERQMIKEAVEG